MLFLATVDTMSNLQPTPIVDKNGKHTTVRKRTAPLSSRTASKIPGPTVTAAKPAGTPFVAPKLLSDNDAGYYWQRMIANRHHGGAGWGGVTAKQVSLIQRIMAEKTMPEPLLWKILIHDMGKWSPGSSVPEQHYNSLLVMERYVRNYSDVDFDVLEMGRSCLGLLYKKSQPDRIPQLEPITEEELDGRAAIVRFTQITREADATYLKRFKLAEGGDTNGFGVYGRYIRNVYLTDYIASNPDRVYDVEYYINEHGVPKNKTDVTEMQRLLATQEPMSKALQDGWL